MKQPTFVFKLAAAAALGAGVVAADTWAPNAVCTSGYTSTAAGTADNGTYTDQYGAIWVGK